MGKWIESFVILLAFVFLLALFFWGGMVVNDTVVASIMPNAVVVEATETPEPLVECELFSINKGSETYRCIDPDYNKVCYDKPGMIMWCEGDE